MLKLNFFGAFMIVTFAVISVSGGKTKTGEYKNGVLTDQQFGYTMTIPDNWRVKTLDEPSIERALFLKRNYEINRTIKDLGGEFTIPEISVFARPDSLTPAAFLEQLKIEVASHKSADNIISQLDLITTGEFSMMQQTMIDSVPTIQAIFKKNYSRKLEVDPNDARYRQYGGLLVQNEWLVNEIYILSHKGRLFVIQTFAEREFYPMNREEFRKIVGSLKFIDLVQTTPAATETPAGK